jgi:hypothetical protein
MAGSFWGGGTIAARPGFVKTPAVRGIPDRQFLRGYRQAIRDVLLLSLDRNTLEFRLRVFQISLPPAKALA